MNSKNEFNLRDTLYRMQVGFASSLDPATVNETIGREVTDNVYERLVCCISNEDITFQPMLASSWSISSDKLTYVFNIRENVKFHDGSSLDALTVVKSLKRMLYVSEKAKLIFKDFIDTNSFNIINKFILEIKLKKYCPDFLDYISMQEASIISPNVLAVNNERTISNWLNKNACGTGPFKVSSYNEVDLEIVLIRNEEYWREKSKLKEVKIKTVHNYEDRKKLLISGIADIISVQASKLQELQNYEEISIKSYLALDMILFVLNIKNRFLSNIFLRKAIAHSFDYNLFLKDVRRGFGSRIATPIPKGVFAHNDLVQDVSFDYNLATNNLIKSNIDVKLIPTIKILCVKGMEDAEVACDMLAAGLGKLGIKSVVVKEYFEEYSKRFDKKDFDIAFLSWAPDSRTPDNNIFQFFHSKGEVAKVVGYSDELIDQKIELAQSECDDKRREKMYFELQEQLVREHLYIWLYQGHNLKVFRENVHGLKYNQLDGDYYFYPIYKV